MPITRLNAVRKQHTKRCCIILHAGYKKGWYKSLSLHYHMARIICMELNLAVGKINGMSPNFIPLTFNICIKNSRHLHSLKYILIIMLWISVPSQVCKIKRMYHLYKGFIGKWRWIKWVSDKLYNVWNALQTQRQTLWYIITMTALVIPHSTSEQHYLLCKPHYQILCLYLFSIGL